MSLIVKGIDMPKYKGEHKNFDRYGCFLTVYKNGEVELHVFENDYTIEEISTPHGRLVDANNLVKVLQNTLDNYPDNYNDRKTVEKLIVAVCKRYIENAPTVIEAEVSE